MNKTLKTLFFLAIFSCSKKKISSNNPLDYIADTTAISIDRRTEPYTRTMQYKDGDLYWWNSNRGSISQFDLSKKMLKKTIKMEQDGPNGLGFPLGFFVVHPDSIYVPNSAFKINLINSEGKWMDNYDYLDFEKLGGVVAFMTRYSNMPKTDGREHIYFIMRDLKNISIPELTEQALQEYPPILSFNKNKGTFEYLDFRAPSSILKFKDFVDFGLTSNSKSLLLLHYQSNTLYEVDFNGINFKEHYLQSELINRFSNEYFISDRMSNSIEDNTRIVFKNSENFGIAYDPNKKLLYRFGWPGEEIPKDVDAMQFDFTPPYFVIGVYDGTDFSLIKEFTLPRNTYLAHHYFVDEKGLNLFPMHPENPEFNEDEMVIHTFDFSGLK